VLQRREGASKLNGLQMLPENRKGADDVTESGRLFHARAAATEKARSPIVERAVAAGRSVPQSPPNAAVDVTRPPPPGECHQQGTVVQVHSDSGTSKPPAKT